MSLRYPPPVKVLVSPSNSPVNPKGERSGVEVVGDGTVFVLLGGIKAPIRFVGGGELIAVNAPSFQPLIQASY